MSMWGPKLILQIIITLDSLCFGLLYPFFSPYILKLGGDHIVLGIATAGILIASLLSKDVTDLFTHIHGRKFALFIIFNIAAIMHVFLIMTESYWFTILVRILFSLTNQSQEISRELLSAQAETDKEKAALNNRYSILGSIGYIVGPIISGFLFDYSYAYSGLLAAVLTVINIGLLFSIPRGQNDTNPEHAEISVLNKAIIKVKNDINLIPTSNLNDNWDLLVVKYLFFTNVAIFYTKYTQILKHNFNASSAIIGFTAAYINLVVFTCTYCIPSLKAKFQEYPTVILTELALLILGILTLFACYAPVYQFFMFLLVPIILMRTFLNTVWKELYEERHNESLNTLNNSVGVLSGVTSHLLFGVFCNNIKHHAVILFSVGSILSSFFIVKRYTRADGKLKAN